MGIGFVLSLSAEEADKIEESDRDLDAIVREMCEKLLTNTVIEDYRYDVEEAVSK